MKKRGFAWPIAGWLIAGLAVILAVPLVWLFRDFVRDVILTEVLRTAWAVGFVLNSFPQVPLWMFFVFIVFAVAFRSVFPRTRFPAEPLPPEPKRAGRLASLAERIERAPSGDYYRWDLARHLGVVIIDVLAHQARIEPGDVRRRLRAGQLDAPPAILRYLLSGLAPIYTLSDSLIARFRHMLAPSSGPFNQDYDVEQVIRFLEDRLEVPDDSR